MSEQRIHKSKVATIIYRVFAIAIVAMIATVIWRATSPVRVEWHEFQAWKHAGNTEIVAYEVEYGDSLWTIADRYVGPDQDIREKIYEILDHNGMRNVDLQPGQELLIPVEKYNDR